MIFNLSFPEGGSVNDNIMEECKPVEYCTITDVASYLLDNFPCEGAFLAKVDLQDAYRFVPVRKADWRHLGMQVGDDVYVDRMLPMGAASSCQIFQMVSDAIKWMFLREYQGEVRVFNYLDDFLFVASTEVLCNSALDCFERVCGEAKVPISVHKTIRAVTSLTFLGIGIDARRLGLFLPEGKVIKYHAALTAFLQSDRPSVKKWQQLAGKLVHAAQVITAGRVFIGSVYASLAGVLSQEHHMRRRIGSDTRADLQTWLRFLSETPPTRDIRLLRPGASSLPPIYTDASSTVGYGAVMGSLWLAGLWPSAAWSRTNIAVLELYPIYLALELWSAGTRDTTVYMFTDNNALVPVLNRLYAKDTSLRRLLRPIVLGCLSRNLLIKASHVPGLLNRGPDLLSRGKESEFLAMFPHTPEGRASIPEHLLPERCGFISGVSD